MSAQTADRLSMTRFHALRRQAHDLLVIAAHEDMPEHYRVQAQAAAGVTGLVLHRVPGEPREDDALAIIDDLRAIARAIDQLIEAIGHEANAQFGRIDLEAFNNQLWSALRDNGAIFELDSALERLGEAPHRFERGEE